MTPTIDIPTMGTAEIIRKRGPDEKLAGWYEARVRGWKWDDIGCGPSSNPADSVIVMVEPWRKDWDDGDIPSGGSGREIKG